MNDRKYDRLNDDFDDQLVAYCLGALSPTEGAAVEAQLEEPVVRTRVDEYRAAVEALALSVPLRQPPSDLGARLLARVDTPAAVMTPTVDHVTPRSNTNQSLITRGRRLLWRQMTPWLAAAAMFVVSVGLGVRVWQQEGQLHELQAVLTTPQVVSMEAGEVAPQAQGRFYLAPDTHKGVLLVVDMPTLTADKCYQLWLVGKDDVRDNGGTFRVDERGYAVFLVNAPRPMKDYKRIGITTEPHGGSPGPTSGRVVGASLEQTTPVDWYQ